MILAGKSNTIHFIVQLSGNVIKGLLLSWEPSLPGFNRKVKLYINVTFGDAFLSQGGGGGGGSEFYGNKCFTELVYD